VMQEGSLGGGCLGWWRECRSFEECFVFFGLSPYCLIRGFFLRPFCSCALTVHVIGLLVFATVFYEAFAFNGDLNQWDVAKVTDMSNSKSIRIV
jgi:surface protein